MCDKNFEEIERKIEEWHQSDSFLELYEYLGMNWEDYIKFVENGNNSSKQE